MWLNVMGIFILIDWGQIPFIVANFHNSVLAFDGRLAVFTMFI